MAYLQVDLARLGRTRFHFVYDGTTKQRMITLQDDWETAHEHVHQKPHGKKKYID